MNGRRGIMTVVTPDTAAPLLSVERNFTCHASAVDHAAEHSDLDGPSVEHLARAERVQVLGLAIEGIVGRTRARSTSSREFSRS